IEKSRAILAKIIDDTIDINIVSTASTSTADKLVKIKKPASGGTFFEINNKLKGLLEYYRNGQTMKYANLQDFIYHNRDDLSDSDLIDCANKTKFKKDYEPSAMIELTQEELKLLRSLKFIRMSTKTKVYSTIIQDIETNGTQYVDEFTTFMTDIFATLMAELYNPYEDVLQIIVNWVAQVDLLRSHALTAMTNNYVRPSLAQGVTCETPSYVEAKEVRHPIVEKIHEHIRYMPNDVSLGSQSGDNNGLFLCSTNNGGKSTYLKSVGLNVILAQCGMFVAASSFTFNPFKNLITRLSGTDNMYKRQGSFAVEMSELCTVMNQGNNKTLVLGDEICRGTETDSASDIVAASAIELCHRGINFIFSTHLKTIEQVDEIMQCVVAKKLRYMHFSTTILPDTQEVVFEHKLREGSGQKLYGIEIAEIMGLDPKVVSLSYQLRNRRQNPNTHDIPLGGKQKSRYNSKKLLGLCEIKECERKAIDTHHINGQCTADANGKIEHFHKDEVHNLVGLCKECHLAIHIDKRLQIFGWKQTIQGNVKLLYRYN
ncbi:MAG: MutS-related protein, partial [Candidatus Roizmanbacteria bacterium]